MTKQEFEQIFQPGAKVHGFLVERTFYVAAFHAQTATLTHEVSGATAYLMNNEDGNLGFSIAARVLQDDCTDIPHVLEHTILAGSAKFPSSDLFFDMDNRAYRSYMNAMTTQNATYFPVTSLSQEQLERIADAYLSCFVDPLVMKEENFFLREGLRYELDDPDEKIRMEGTVFTEDLGLLTDQSSLFLEAMQKNLFAGTYAGNSVGGAATGYADLCYEKAQAVYRRYYHFDNSLIVLYGDMDYIQMLQFLDQEYLSKYPKSGVGEQILKEQSESLKGLYQNKGDASMDIDILRAGNLSDANVVASDELTNDEATENPAPALAYWKKVLLPAFENDQTDGQDTLIVAMDLTPASELQLRILPYFAALMNLDSSVFEKALLRHGVTSEAVCDNEAYNGSIANVLACILYNGQDEDEETFALALKETLQEIVRGGFPAEDIETVRRTQLFGEMTTMNGSEVFTDSALLPVGSYWAATGKTDIYESFEQEMEELLDPEQKVLRSIAEMFLAAIRGCGGSADPVSDGCDDPVSGGCDDAVFGGYDDTVFDECDSANRTAAPHACFLHLHPLAGLAEQMEQERIDHLRSMKEQMSPAQIDELILKTQAFREWNSKTLTNRSFMIDPQDLPAPLPDPEVYTEVDGDLTILSADSHLQGVIDTTMFFDTSMMEAERVHDLSLLTDLFGELTLTDMTKEELDRKSSLLFPEFTVTLTHGGQFSKYDHPGVQITFQTLSEDHREALELMLKILREQTFHAEEILRAMDRFTETYNPAYQDSAGAAQIQANARMSHIERYQTFVMKGYYSYLNEEAEKLEEDPEYASILGERLKVLADHLLTRTNLLVMVTADESERSQAVQTLREILGALPEHPAFEKQEIPYDLEGERLGIVMSTALTDTLMVAPVEPGALDGRYIPFITALSDQYIVPVLRLKGKAYTAEAFFNAGRGGQLIFATYEDQNPRFALDTFAQAQQALEDLEVCEKDLQGYILSAYGSLNYPLSVSKRAKYALLRRQTGFDSEKMSKVIADVRFAQVSDRVKAVEFWKKCLEHRVVAVAGNKSILSREADLFDRVMDEMEEA